MRNDSAECMEKLHCYCIEIFKKHIEETEKLLETDESVLYIFPYELLDENDDKKIFGYYFAHHQIILMLTERRLIMKFYSKKYKPIILQREQIKELKLRT